MVKSYWKGIDCYQTRPDKHDSLNCRACGAKMDVRRSVMAQTGPYHPKSLCDVFSCPNTGSPGHDLKVIKIRRGDDDAMY